MIPNARPTTEEQLEGLLRQAYDLAKKGDYASALELCDWLVEDRATRVAALRKRAAVHEHEGNIEKAIDDLEEVISEVSDEAADMHALGLLYLQVDRSGDAESVLDRGVRICVAEQFEYYLNPCRILRAEALLRLQRPSEALLELEHLPQGYSTYVYGRGNRTKEVMSAEARCSIS